MINPVSLKPSSWFYLPLVGDVLDLMSFRKRNDEVRAIFHEVFNSNNMAKPDVDWELQTSKLIKQLEFIRLVLDAGQYRCMGTIAICTACFFAGFYPTPAVVVGGCVALLYSVGRGLIRDLQKQIDEMKIEKRFGFPILGILQIDWP